MALKKKELKEFKKMVDECHRPLIFFDDDCDGLSSFLQVYKYVGDGRGIPVKDSPEVQEKYARKATEYQPDLVIILDKPLVSQDFLDKVKHKVVWLDHHEPQNPRGNVTYLNPRIHDDKDNRPTSYWVYKALQKNLWIAMTGVVADWAFPKDIAKKFRKEYPELLPKDIKTAPAAIHDSPLGEMTRIWSFNMKGTIRDTLASIKTLTRIEEPSEILEQTTPKGKYIYKKYARMKNRYQELYDSIEVDTDEKVIVFIYQDDIYSYTADLSNEVLHRHSDKVTIIGRNDQGWIKASFRSPDINIEVILQECLKGVRGRGGGHDKACGAAIHEDDFDDFLTCFRKKVDEAYQAS